MIKLLSFVTEGSPSGDAAKPAHRGVMMTYCGSTKAEARAEGTAPRTVLDAKKEPVVPEPVSLEEFLEAQADSRFCREHSKSVRDPQSCIDYDRYEIPVRKAKLDGAV